MKAVILAAGQGIRIREHHQLPKGFIQINDKALILHSLEKLKHAGIQDILVVTGFKSEEYEKLAQETKLFTTVYNEKFAEYGSLYSLYCARNWVSSDFLLLESDILYDSFAINLIANHCKSNVVLISNETLSGDEVYVCAEDGFLTAMSKNKQELDQQKIVGEFVGVNKLSHASYQQLITMLENDATLLQTGNYEEQGLIRLGQIASIYCLKPQSLKWCEIDNLAHLERAKKLYLEMN